MRFLEGVLVEQRSYHMSNDALAIEGNIINGMKNGPFRYYDPEGNIIKEVIYIDDVLMD